jgi:exopolysaccharide biosynthesis polyprenyl glycosylphosphotransferase
MATSDSAVTDLYAETIGTLRQERRAISRERFNSVVAVFETSSDFLLCALGIFVIPVFCKFLHIGAQTQHPVKVISIIFGLVMVLMLHREGACCGSGGPLQIRETERIFRSSAQSLFLLLILNVLLGLDLPKVALLIAIVLVTFLLILEKQIFLSIIRIFHSKEYGVDRVAIYGPGDEGRSIVSTLLHAPKRGFHPVALIDNNTTLSPGCIFGTGHRRYPIPVLPGPVAAELLKSWRCTLLMIATSNLSRQEVDAATQQGKRAGLHVMFLYGSATQEQRTKSTNIDDLLLTSSIEQFVPWHYVVAKRTFDLAVSSLLMILLSPLLFLIATLIRLDSSGPALFVQKRVGWNGGFFNIYKFRSMHTDALMYDFSPTTSSDPRITRLGRILRRMSLDELPQLINVFLGNMSLVGPRPEMPFIVEYYNSHQRQRLQVAPGITGLWQLSADRIFPIHENLHYDLYYIRNRTFFMDMAILIHTVFFAMRRGI